MAKGDKVIAEPGDGFQSEPFRQNPFAMPTDDKLKADAASVVDQVIHYWNPGEVECVVILARPGSSKPAFAYCQMTRERLLRVLQLVEAESVIQKSLIHKGRPTR